MSHELMVTGAVPLELSVTGNVVGVFNVTLPNARLAGLMVNWRIRHHRGHTGPAQIDNCRAVSRRIALDR